MADTIDLENGYVADRIPWEKFVRAVEEAFPDPSGDIDEEEAEFRTMIVARAAAGGNPYWLGVDLELGPVDMMALKRLAALLVPCNVRRVS